MAALAITLMIAWPHYRSRLGRGTSPIGNPQVGTSGHENAPQPVKVGQTARITGTIEAIPNAEARYSWGINDSLRRALRDRQLYIRADADNVTPEG